MKKILIAFAAVIALAACNSKQAAAPEAEDGNAAQEVAFTVAQNYFFKNNQQLPDNPKITTAEEFNKLFGMATTMGEETDSAYQVVFRSYTGALVYFYVDKASGTTKMVEHVPALNIENEAGTIEIADYLKKGE